MACRTIGTASRRWMQILHGKHIYYEKPMAMSFEESRRVREAVRRKKVVFQFGTQQRSDLKIPLGLRIGAATADWESCARSRFPRPLPSSPSFPEQPVPDCDRLGPLGGPRPDDAV